MKIAVIGATGFVGTALLKELTDRGHEVTAIARHPEKLSVKGPLVHPVAADVLNIQQIADLVKRHDAVVSAYNPGWDDPQIYEHFMAGARAIQEAVRRSGVKRLIVIGGAGSLEVSPGVQLIDTPHFPAAYKAGASGARDYLGELRGEKELEWTYFSPAIFMNHEHSGVRRGHYRLGIDSPVFDAEGKSVLSVEDLAVVIADELERPKHVRMRFTAGY
ncbi:MAG TPA: NAD(P)H-binding protein [Puia sp.]|nr:NAD(P)H-binding protein [Puia sp.]